MTNQYVKYDDFAMNTFHDKSAETIQTFKAPVTLTFNLVTLKSIGVI
jgi:hypothetical protein